MYETGKTTEKVSGKLASLKLHNEHLEHLEHLEFALLEFIT